MATGKLLLVIGLTIGWIALTVNTIRRLIENHRKLRQLEKEIEERLKILRNDDIFRSYRKRKESEE